MHEDKKTGKFGCVKEMFTHFTFFSELLQCPATPDTKLLIPAPTHVEDERGGRCKSTHVDVAEHIDQVTLAGGRVAQPEGIQATSVKGRRFSSPEKFRRM